MAGDVAGWLAGQFGGQWRRFDGGDVYIPGAVLWAQFREDADGKTVLVGMLLLADGITSARLRAIPIGELEAAAAAVDAGGEAGLRSQLEALDPLARGSLGADDFYALVAEHFKVWARHERQPVARMARAAGVNPATMHAWVSRARARGLLPVAARGKRVREG